NLVAQFFNCTRTAARDCLVTGGKDASKAERPMKWIERHQCHCGGAVWVRDQSAMSASVIWIYFRDHQRHSLIHPECGRIIDHNRTSLLRFGGKFSGDV